MSWKKVKLNEVLKQYRIEHWVQDNKSYKQVSILNDGSVVLRGEKNGKEIGRKRQFIIDLDKFSNTLIFTRQLLLQGSIGIASKDVDKCIVTENMPMFSIEKNILPEYLVVYLKSEVFREQVRNTQTSGTAQKIIHERQFLEYLIPLPTITEQKEFVRKFKATDEFSVLSSELQQQTTLIKKLRQSILQEAVQGNLVPQNSKDEPASILLEKIKAEKQKLIAEGKLKKEKPLPPIAKVEIPFELPKGWAWCRLGEVVDLITKGSSPTWQGVNYVDKEEVLFVTSENVDSYKLDLTKRKYVEFKFNDIEPRSILQRGDFLMNIVGASIGRTAIYNIDELANINQAVCLIRKSTKYIDSSFLLHFFNSPICISYMFDKQVDNARPNLSMGNISKFLIPLPPLSQQQRIVKKVEELMSLCDQLEKEVSNSTLQVEQLMQSVLREAFENKKEVAHAV